MTTVAPLRPLACIRCGAAVELGQGRAAHCRYCGAETPIPSEYISLQRSARSFAEDRRLARELYGDVGKPPGRFFRAWGESAQRSSRIGTIVAGVLVWLSLGVPYLGLPLVAAAAYVLGYPIALVMRVMGWGPLSPYIILPIAALLVVLFVAVPAILFGRERALAAVRRDIQASLAAAMPEHPGGPCRCRSCGAALEVPDGALGVPCTYCKADNLVALPGTWVARIQRSEFQQFMRIDAALEAFRDASRVAQERLWKLVFAMILVFPLVFLIAYLFEALGLHF